MLPEFAMPARAKFLIAAFTGSTLGLLLGLGIGGVLMHAQTPSHEALAAPTYVVTQ